MEGTEMKIRSLVLAIGGIVLLSVDLSASAGERIKLTPGMSEHEIARLHPKDVDPSLLPLDSIEELGRTGTPQEVNITTWRLEVRGERVKAPLSLTYENLVQIEMTKKRVILICPGFFVDYAEWEGIPLSTIFEKAKVEEDYEVVSFYGLDGYSSRFSREEAKNNFLFLALKVNGEVLPEEHGFPVRLVAEDVLGGRWVKWISAIEVK
jgi:DMSO/TMAO reductase YedYZ molybdopterin-dependent catalytic subunit